MPYFSQDLDIEIDEFLDECTPSEIKELIQELEDRGFAKPKSYLDYETIDQDWSDMLIKIMENKHQLTVEDELIVQNIFKKLI